MPTGRKSVNAANSVVAAALLLPSVIVRVLVPPDVIAVGENDFSTDGGVVTPTANIPIASAVLLPRLVFRSPAAMMFMETPGALDVTSTDMLQPPGGITAPDAKLTVALPAEAVTDALEQLPPMLGVFATRMPAGSVSISADVSSAAVALLLPSEMVRVLTEPPAIAEGENCFATVGGAKVTFRSAVTGPALLPRFVCSVLAARLLVAVPGVAEVTSRLMTQPVVAGMTAPLAYVIAALPAVAVTEPVAQFPPRLVGFAIVMPNGRASVKLAESVAGDALLLPRVMVSMLVPRDEIVAGEKDLAVVGSSAITSAAEARLGLLPRLVWSASAATLLVAVPIVLEVTLTMMVQPLFGIDAPLAYLTVAPEAVIEPTVQVPAPVLTTDMPVGSVSVKIDESVMAEPLGLPRVMVN